MKQIVLNILGLLLLIFLVRCGDSGDMPGNLREEESVIHVEASIARPASLLSVEKDLNTDNVLLTWDKGFFNIRVIVKQGEKKVEVRNVEIKSVSADGHTALFDVRLPVEINAEKPFDLIGCVGNRLLVQDGKILLGVEAHSMYDLFGFSSNKDEEIPVWFHAKDVTVGKSLLNVTFQHLGSMAVIGLYNSSDAELRTAGLAMLPHDADKPFYHKAALPFVGNTELPYINLLQPVVAPEMIKSHVEYPEVMIPAHSFRYVGFWFMPNGNTTPEVDLVAYDAVKRTPIVSVNTLPDKGKKMVAGKAYNLFAQWDGKQLAFTAAKPEFSYENTPYVTVRTEKEAGDRFQLIIDGTDMEACRDIWVDLNNNGKREKGENIAARKFSSDYESTPLEFTLQSQEFKIYGPIAFLWVNNNEITQLNIQKCPSISYLSIIDNKITTMDVSKNTGLRTAEMGWNRLESIIFGNNEKLEDIYLNHNRIKSIDIHLLTSLYAVDLSENRLEEITLLDKHPEMIYMRLQDNQLNADIINKVYNCLPDAGERIYSWMYTIKVGNNPGAGKADHAIATAKGWSVSYR